jgi:ribosomal subunit interface protein
MDLVLKGRGVRITDQIRSTVEHKLAKISRLDPRVRRIEVEVSDERNPKIDGTHAVHVACTSSRHVFRAEGAGHGIDAALDQAVAHLERQITSYRGKLRDRRQAGATV